MYRVPPHSRKPRIIVPERPALVLPPAPSLAALLHDTDAADLRHAAGMLRKRSDGERR